LWDPYDLYLNFIIRLITEGLDVVQMYRILNTVVNFK